MHGFDLFHHSTWKPFESIGLTNNFFVLFKDTIVNTWVTLVCIVVVCFVGRYFLRKKGSLGNYIALLATRFFMSIAEQGSGTEEKRYMYLVASLFVFIFVSSALVMFYPWCEEPTKDLNTTFALALISFFFTQIESIRVKGAWSYMQAFIKAPLPLVFKRPVWLYIPYILIAFVSNTALTLAFLPLELMSKFTSTISLSFRLFGNIFAGSVIASLWGKLRFYTIIAEVLGIVLTINFVIMLFFGLFESLIQAYVFSILTATYIGMGISREGH